MSTTAITSKSLLTILLVISLAAAPAATAKLLTGPSEGTPLEIALGYLQAQQAELGLGPADLADVIVRDQYVSAKTGVTHLYLSQRLGGVEVVNGVINVNVMPDGSILSLGNRFVSNLAAGANTLAPSIQPELAIARAAEHLGGELTESPALLEVVGGPAMEAVFGGAGLSHDPIPTKLMYLPREEGARLVWSLVIRQVGVSDWWNVFVDATTGAVLEKHNWTVSETVLPRARSQAGPRAPAGDAGAGSGGERGCTSNCYEVFALPKESPYNGPRTLEQDPADPIASPFGWHDTDGAAGAEFTDSRGNNVEAQTDLDANNVFSAGDVRSEGGPNLVFSDPLDLDLQPDTYLEAAVTNLYYYNNIMHDVSYRYGFDEPAGNFQQNNYGNGGASGDPVQADAQDGSGTNNANFATPPDGVDPRMQMFVWTNPFSQSVLVNAPGSIAGSYVANPSNNGGVGNGLTADMAIVDDGVAPATDACEPLLNDLTGKIALIVWNQGACNSSVFVANAANAGAVGAVIVDNTEEPFTNFGGSPLIPSVAVGEPDGLLFFDTITGGATVNATLEDNPDPAGSINRDSDLDNGIIGHEYGHGISNRLVGGPSSTGCLGNQEQAGEGWSDWWTLVLSAQPGDTAEMPRGIGNYSSFRPEDGVGIRNFPYSTNLGVNPQTYADIGSTNVPHGVGEIWNAMLWEMYWLLVQRDGFDPDFYDGSGGNNLAIQLVVDGMKLTPCSPGFVDGRDGILAADVALTGGANECQIWTAFAKRGVGFSADQGSSFTLGDETEAFDFPPGLDSGCAFEVFSDGFESGDTSAWSSSVP